MVAYSSQELDFDPFNDEVGRAEVMDPDGNLTTVAAILYDRPTDDTGKPMKFISGMEDTMGVETIVYIPHSLRESLPSALFESGVQDLLYYVGVIRLQGGPERVERL